MNLRIWMGAFPALPVVSASASASATANDLRTLAFVPPLLAVSAIHPAEAAAAVQPRWGIICRISCESIFQARLFTDTEVKSEPAVFRPRSDLGNPPSSGNLGNLTCSTYLSVDYEDYVLFEVKLSEGEMGNFENLRDDWRLATVRVTEVEPVVKYVHST
eukprot:CAMPEP_0173262380 /NCGR_PEP_ID=MMETSP1142-20121109/26743_1 /TAXON_ID=483371 /ORGANISM="non described non described, Strain CCMP2298" /LENGTH=159 /DNA_ID=CAMNT_0014197513 /DNA_START=330 /DNA_END=809 /DNA_ORIENTATION=+